MKYFTKQKRLVAIFDTYCERYKKRGATIDEAVVWALEHGLWPVPKRGDSAAACEAWERKLLEASASEVAL